jgi:hypothetical protein
MQFKKKIDLRKCFRSFLQTIETICYSYPVVTFYDENWQQSEQFRHLPSFTPDFRA